MAVKHFVINEQANPLSKIELNEIEDDRVLRYTIGQAEKNITNKKVNEAECKLKHTQGRVLIKADTQAKNWHTFENGTKIRRERQFNEFNKRITEPVNGIVVSADNIPTGSEILIHHNSIHDTNRIFDYTPLSGVFEATDIRYYSIPEAECYAWRDESGTLQPMKNYAFALRVYEPYKGFITGIEPTLIKNVLYIYTGNLHGSVCHVLPSSDYEVIFQGQKGREEKVIRCRHFQDKIEDREEVIAISNVLTERLNNGELLVGLSPTTANTIDKNIVS